MRPFTLVTSALLGVAAAASSGAQSAPSSGGLAAALSVQEFIVSGTVTSALTSTKSLAASQVPEPEFEVDVIEFENVGYTGYYYDVKTISNPESSSCSCTLSSSFTVFEGSNSPLNEELSVHFRGPLSLKQFAYYIADDSSSGTWNREAYYDASAQTAENVTFVNNQGKASQCLGNALTYASKNGTGAASLATVLESGNVVESNEEYAIYSNVSCPSSGFDKACGVYRDGIPAYHGYGGTTKLFLFEFTMPETNVTDKSTSYYNMPAIWFLNAKIARTGQYATNSNCSCWGSGCGELDAFEIVNLTYPYRLASTIHGYQGSDNVNLGIAASGYFTRSTTSTMKGGVRFGTDGTVSIFMLDSLSFDSSLSASLVTQWIDNEDVEDIKVLSSITMNTSATAALSSKKSGGNTVQTQGWFTAAVTLLMLALIYV